jgi:hypothetical protein
MNLRLSQLRSQGPGTSNPSFGDTNQKRVFQQKNLHDLKRGGDMSLLPKPDRSAFRPKLSSMDESEELDNGWVEGKFSDGRPYRAESWSWDHLSAITFFFSTPGVENVSDQGLADLLQREIPLQFRGEKKVSAEKIMDFSGNEMWSVSLLVRDGEETLVAVGLQFKPYEEILSKEERNAIPAHKDIRSRVLKF